MYVMVVVTSPREYKPSMPKPGCKPTVYDESQGDHRVNTKRNCKKVCREEESVLYGVETGS